MPHASPAARPQGWMLELEDGLAGRIILPDDSDYDDARTVFYGGIDRRPSAVVRVAGPADVSRAIGVARAAGLELAVRSGGHGPAGHGVSEGGLVIDLRDLRTMDIDPQARSAWAGTGLTAGAYTAAAGEHGLVTGFGDHSSVGIGGITLGGGVGYLARSHGLTIDDLLAAEVVTADGRILHVDEGSHPDLFWAIRGGGGNFGVATRLCFRLHELPSVLGGMMILPAEPTVVASFLGLAAEAPDALTTIAMVMKAGPMPFVPAEHHGRPILFATMAWSGEPEAGERALAPFRALATPIVDEVREIPYPALFRPAEEGFHPLAAHHAMFLEGVGPDTAEAIVERVRASSASMAAVQLRVLGGAMARVPAGATAFGHRERPVLGSIAAMYEDPARAPEHEAWVADTADVLHPGYDATYVNFLGDEGTGRVRAAYPGATWDRLIAIKRRYDPANLFRLNQNIPPGGV